MAGTWPSIIAGGSVWDVKRQGVDGKNVHSCLNSIPLEGLIGLIFERNTTFLVKSQYFSENIVAIIFGIGIAGVRTPNREVNGVKSILPLFFFSKNLVKCFAKKDPENRTGPRTASLRSSQGSWTG